MNRIYLSLLALVVPAITAISSTSAAETVTFDDGTKWQCDQYFSPVKLRYNYYYGFYDMYRNTNTSRYTNYLNTFSVQYKNADYLLAGGKFDFTPELRAKNFAVAPGEEIKALATQSDNWKVNKHPAVRSTGSAFDFMIAYRINYDTSNNYPDASDDKSHVECQPYQVTWCGDGILDTQYESCDPADPNKTGWGPGGCDASCKPITTQTPQCSSTITGTLSAPISATTPGLCAVGTVSGFTATPGANGTINYQWNCNIDGVGVSPAPTPVSCTANYRPQADLTIKKYIGTNDAQPHAPVTLSTNATFDYVLRVQNVSSLTETGLTTVKDVLPAGVTQNGTPSGANWTCSYAGNTLTCTTTQEIAAGAYFSDITVPVKVTAGANSTVRNDATVHNPNELNTCYTDNRMPTGAEQSCEKDPNNTDPAVFTIGGGGGGGGYTFYVPKCISHNNTCCCSTS